MLGLCLILSGDSATASKDMEHYFDSAYATFADKQLAQLVLRLVTGYHYALVSVGSFRDASRIILRGVGMPLLVCV